MYEDFPNIENCNPRSCISGKVMRSQRIVSSIFRKYLAQFDLTNSQLSTLFVIAKSKGATQVRIAEVMFMDKSTVTRNLSRLLKSNIIEKKGKQVFLTYEGKVFLEKVIPVWEEAMTEMKAKLGSEGLDALDTVVANLTR